MADDESLSMSLNLDATSATKVLDDLEGRSKSFGSALTSALKNATGLLPPDTTNVAVPWGLLEIAAVRRSAT